MRNEELLHLITVAGSKTRHGRRYFRRSDLDPDGLPLGVCSWARACGCTLHVLILEALMRAKNPPGLVTLLRQLLQSDGRV